MAAGLRTLLRGARLLIHIVSGVLVSTAVNLDFSGRLRPAAIARWWSLRLLQILDIELVVHGRRAAGATVTAANHVSWLDIPVISTGEQCQFIAKSEIRHWPVAGSLAKAAGTFYLRRGKGGAKPLIEALVPHLAAGGSVVLFPEGTTTDGRDVLPFHARLFAAAAETGAPVQPIALRYLPAADGTDLAPFIGDDDLVSHLLRLLRCRGLDIEVRFSEPLESTGRTREQLSDAAREAIRSVLAISAPQPGSSRPEQRVLAAPGGSARVN